VIAARRPFVARWRGFRPSRGDLERLDGVPTLEQVLAASRVVSLPMRVRFRGVDTREAVLIEGPSGWGEFSPFVEYGDVEASRWLASALEAAFGAPPPPAVRSSVPVNATVPAVDAAQVEGVLARFDGCTTVKVKVAERGQTQADDVGRVAEVRRLLGSTGRVRVDANGAWSPDEAIAALERLSRFDLEYAEQPSATLEGLRAVRLGLARRGIDVAIAADESVRKAEDPLRVAVAGAADVVVIKVAPLGGVAAAFDVAQRLGAEHGLPVVVSSALDTSVGLAAGVALAAALPELPFACGLGTSSLFVDDVGDPPLRPTGGVLPVARPRVDGARLVKLAASPERDAWWRERLTRCHVVLTGAAGRTGEDPRV
jgi:O-succinylbenzoate synthase